MIDYDIAAEGLVRLTNWWSMNDVWDCGMAFTIGPTFEESYEIRAAILADKTLHLGQVRTVAHAFCDRALLTQGVAEEDMYYMGYGCERDESGVPNCSCVADASSSASAIIDTIKAFPDSWRRDAYIGSLRRFADHVLDRYVDELGVIGVGILGHTINPMSQYWCANALFVQVLIGLHELTGDEKYLSAAIPPLEFLAAYDYRNTFDGNWKLSATEVVFYAGEGIVSGLESEKVCQVLKSKPMGMRLEPATVEAGAPAVVALNRVKADEAAAGKATGGSVYDALISRWNELYNWLYQNQEVTGIWQDSREYRCYQLGLSWLLWKAENALPGDPRTEHMMDRQSRCIVGMQGKAYHGIFSRLFATALAHLSTTALAVRCMEENPEKFNLALENALSCLDDLSW